MGDRIKEQCPAIHFVIKNPKMIRAFETKLTFPMWIHKPTVARKQPFVANRLKSFDGKI